ncbi:hypothetical protein AG1IA_09554 [Rhizoctonia solani AG-1 IA]|uniref:Uncharacterized protein n=1 Tax=Thanatephorus cucumeris (strain AG1-IA) TaxID=983506 RepID=L8WJ77_THACA|nr:hypothetical protein AG1IA_09554 [Rhizoctonia solani AG-1 IA]
MININLECMATLYLGIKKTYVAIEIEDIWWVIERGSSEGHFRIKDVVSEGYWTRHKGEKEGKTVEKYGEGEYEIEGEGVPIRLERANGDLLQEWRIILKPRPGRAQYCMFPIIYLVTANARALSPSRRPTTSDGYTEGQCFEMNVWHPAVFSMWYKSGQGSNQTRNGDSWDYHREATV